MSGPVWEGEPDPGRGHGRVVALTPIALERDSRTFKQASSVARLGYESVVVEQLPSRRREGLPFQLRTVGQADVPAPPPAEATGGGPTGQGGDPSATAAPAGRLPEPLGALLAFIRYFWEFLRSFARDTARATPDADLYYLHAYLQFPAVYLRSRRRRVPFVYDAHDFYSSFAPRETLGDRMESWFRGRVEKACVKRAAEVVTVSPGCAELIESRFGRRPLVIRNCPDLRLDEPAGTDVRRAAGLGDDAFLLVLAGNWKPGMALDEALLALSQLPDRVHLAFVGGGYAGWDERAGGKGLGSRVHFIPPVRPTQVDDLIRTADLAAILYRGLTSSYVHMLPNGFFHAVAAGLPVLYPELPDVTAIATKYELGLPIDPADPDSVAAAVRLLLDDPAMLAEFRANAERARDSLNWQREERVLAELIDRVLQNRRP